AVSKPGTWGGIPRSYDQHYLIKLLMLIIRRAGTASIKGNQQPEPIPKKPPKGGFVLVARGFIRRAMRVIPTGLAVFAEELDDVLAFGLRGHDLYEGEAVPGEQEGLRAGRHVGDALAVPTPGRGELRKL